VGIQLSFGVGLARRVRDLPFNPQVEEFAPRTTWSLSNAFTSALKELDPIPQFKATAKLASFLEPSTPRSAAPASERGCTPFGLTDVIRPTLIQTPAFFDLFLFREHTF
jgi:hypothetical protein